ncbi:MAG: hypothetical protein JNK58_05350 [Phycisphaerae bacterium]|nr:hypothetical protein [Phycisphaerae bacterium]
MNQPVHHDCTRLTEPQLLSLLEGLSRTARTRPDSRRKDVRYEYHVPQVKVVAQHQSAGSTGFIMHARNISRGGISLLHGGFLHTRTHCTVTLSSVHGKAHLVMGEVVGCRHVARNIHEVSIRFYEKISIDDICGPGAKECLEHPGAPGVPQLQGLAICLAKSDAARREMLGWLSATGLDAVEARTIGALIDKLRRLTFVVAVVDAGRAEWSAEEAAQSVRDAGFTGGLIVVDPGSFSFADADAVLHRPLDEKSFRAALMQTMRSRSSDEISPIYSTLSGADADRGLLERYVENALATAATIEGALGSSDGIAVRSALDSLRRTAGGYGFGVVGQAAASALGVLDQQGLLHASREINVVVSMCRRLSAEVPPAKAE